jgi:hypothetical protein
VQLSLLQPVTAYRTRGKLQDAVTKNGEVLNQLNHWQAQEVRFVDALVYAEAL